MVKELTIPQQKTLEKVLARKKKRFEMLRYSPQVFPDKVCKGCGGPVKITCKANVKSKLYCKDSCKPKR